MPFVSLRSYLNALRGRQNELVEINAEVDPHLELAEIHRRTIEEEGPALLFRNVRGSRFPVVTNLFGTKKRVELAFGNRGPKLIERIAKLPEELMPPSLQTLWGQKDLLGSLLKVGLSKSSKAEKEFLLSKPGDLNELPIITSWSEDGGPFVTLPLVYTEHPENGTHNLGMYRLQRFSSTETGLHMQIGKGGGFHLSCAKELAQNLPVNVFLGGPPAVLLSAISPLPENVPELLLASLLLEKKLPLLENPEGPLPLLREAEFVLTGYTNPQETRPEGPFGDHYGYYSLTHDFPVFHCEAVFHRKGAIYPATVVGKPRQEDYFIGNYLQELLSPLFPLVMPAVKDLWSYGETGYHSLAAAVVRERYKREALVSGFRILGEGQLSLTKFLLLTDREMDLKNFRAVLKYILARADFRSDLYVFSNTAMDTLDYTGTTLNEGSKGILMGMGEARRTLPSEFSGPLPSGIDAAEVFCPGCLVISGPSYKEELSAAARIAQTEAFSDWPLIVLSDNAKKDAKDEASFLWSTFTRFAPATDIYARETVLSRYHPELTPPVVIDARMKPGYPDELECDKDTEKLVDKRWNTYFNSR